jgi:hypothetical protein
MEHDPFSPLEGAKLRNIPVGPSVGAGPVGSSNFGTAPQAPPAGKDTSSTSTQSGDHGNSVPVTGGGTVATPSSTATAPPRALVTPGVPPSPTASATGTDTSSLSAQLRDLLDPATLAEIRRLEASSAPGAAIEALERAAAALRARADRLSGQSQALRARSHAR